MINKAKPLLVIAVLIAAAVLTISSFTQQARITNAEKQQWQFLEQLLSDYNANSTVEKTLKDNVFLVSTEKQSVYLVLQKDKGFMGSIELALAFDGQANLLNAMVLNHQETPSYTGDIEQFMAQLLSSYSQSENTVLDHITRASVTSRAVLRTIEQAQQQVKALQESYED